MPNMKILTQNEIAKKYQHFVDCTAIALKKSQCMQVENAKDTILRCIRGEYFIGEYKDTFIIFYTYKNGNKKIFYCVSVFGNLTDSKVIYDNCVILAKKTECTTMYGAGRLGWGKDILKHFKKEVCYYMELDHG